MHNYIATTALCLVVAGLAACSGEPTDQAAQAPETAEETSSNAMPIRPDNGEVPQAEAEQTAMGCGPVSSSSYCGVFFGMSPEQAREAYAGTLTTAGEVENPACYYLNPSPDNYDIGLMVNEGSVARVDVRGGDQATTEGAMIGTTISELKALYPSAEEEPNKYTDYPNIVVTGESGNRLIFETGENGRVTRYRAGIMPAVGFVEGCL